MPVVQDIIMRLTSELDPKFRQNMNIIDSELKRIHKAQQVAMEPTKDARNYAQLKFMETHEYNPGNKKYETAVKNFKDRWDKIESGVKTSFDPKLAQREIFLEKAKESALKHGFIQRNRITKDIFGQRMETEMLVRTGGKELSLWKRGTEGMKLFRMEMLSVMFFGMALQRFFMGLIQPAMDAFAVFDVWNTMLTVLFIPVMEYLQPILLDFMTWVMDLPDPVKKAIGVLTLVGIVMGTLLFAVGTLVLGLGGLSMAFPAIVAGVLGTSGASYVAAGGVSALGFAAGGALVTLGTLGLVIIGLYVVVTKLVKVYDDLKKAFSGGGLSQSGLMGILSSFTQNPALGVGMLYGALITKDMDNATESVNSDINKTNSTINKATSSWVNWFGGVGYAYSDSTNYMMNNTTTFTNNSSKEYDNMLTKLAKKYGYTKDEIKKLLGDMGTENFNTSVQMYKDMDDAYTKIINRSDSATSDMKKYLIAFKDSTVSDVLNPDVENWSKSATERIIAERNAIDEILKERQRLITNTPGGTTEDTHEGETLWYTVVAQLAGEAKKTIAKFKTDAEASTYASQLAIQWDKEGKTGPIWPGVETQWLPNSGGNYEGEIISTPPGTFGSSVFADLASANEFIQEYISKFSDKYKMSPNITGPYPYLNKYFKVEYPNMKYGGIVNGKLGEQVPIMAHGGERFLGMNETYNTIGDISKLISTLREPKEIPNPGNIINKNEETTNKNVYFNPTYNINISDKSELNRAIKDNNDKMLNELRRLL